MNKIAKTILTEDGSITCIEPSTGELYHNKAGAFTEALLNYAQVCNLVRYINNQRNDKTKISVLDICFGLGYNSLVLLEVLLDLIKHDQIKSKSIDLRILGIDQDSKILNIIPQVLSNSQFKILPAYLTRQKAQDMVLSWQNSGLYHLEINSQIPLSVLFEIKIADIRKAVPDLSINEEQFDYIFHDGFNPTSMPELWTIDLFQLYKKMLAKNGCVVTYSSACAVRGAFKEAGFIVKRTQALGRKSGGTVAFTDLDYSDNFVFDLNAEENERLNSRSSIPYRDQSFSSSRLQIIKRRETEIAQSELPRYKS